MVNMDNKDTKGQTLITHDCGNGTVTHPIGMATGEVITTSGGAGWVYMNPIPLFMAETAKVAEKWTKGIRDMESQRKDRELWKIRQREANRRK
jgi:hypothetical protein